MRGHGADVRRPQRPRALRTSEGKVGGCSPPPFGALLTTQWRTSHLCLAIAIPCVAMAVAAGSSVALANGCSPIVGSSAGGTLATMTGACLVASITVTFGGEQGTVVTANNTDMTVLTPAHAFGTTPVVVQHCSPCHQAYPPDFVFGDLGTIAGMSPDQGTTAGGGAVAITGPFLDQATSVRFGATDAASFTIASASLITAIAPVGVAGAVDVTFTTEFGSRTSLAAFTYAVPAAPAAAPPGVVTQVDSGTRQVLFGGRTRLVFDLRYERSGRFSFFLQRPRASRISIIRGSRIGDRVLRKAFFAPVVQQGQAGTMVRRPLIVKGMPEAGSVMRAILSQADGSLDGAQFPLAPNTPVSEMGL